MKVSDVVSAFETIAPPSLAADWDNVGLLVGDPTAAVRKLLLCIDLTPRVLAEARSSAARMVMAYHPVIFKPLSRVTASGAGAVAYEAARRGVAVYSMHTALDAAPGGTSDVLADALGLADRRPLAPTVRAGQCKVVVFTPGHDVSRVAASAFAAGAGRIGDYTDCSFHAPGTGTFYGPEGTRPAVGRAGRHESVPEVRLEMICPKASAPAVLEAVRAAHRYEEPAIDVYPLEDHPAGSGMGRVGRLKRPVGVGALIARVKKAAGVGRVLVAAGPGGAGAKAPVSVAACCAGSAGAMFRAAAEAGATFYLTGEMRHHDAMAAAGAGMTVVCLGHSNSERMALRPLAKRVKAMLAGLKVAVARTDRDPFEIV